MNEKQGASSPVKKMPGIERYRSKQVVVSSSKPSTCVRRDAQCDVRSASVARGGGRG